MPPAVAEPVFKPRQSVLDLWVGDPGEVFCLQCPHLVLGAIAHLSVGGREVCWGVSEGHASGPSLACPPSKSLIFLFVI